MKATLIVISTIIFFGHCTCIPAPEDDYEEAYTNDIRVHRAYAIHYKKVNLYAHKYLYPGLTNLVKNIDSVDLHFYNAHDFKILLKFIFGFTKKNHFLDLLGNNII